MNKKKKLVLKKHRKNKARIRFIMQEMVLKKKVGSIESAAKKPTVKKVTAKKVTAKKATAKKATAKKKTSSKKTK